MLPNCCVVNRCKNKIIKEINYMVLEKNGGFIGLAVSERSAGFKKEHNVKIIVF